MACSSRQLLEEVINEVERKESILGKDRRQTMGSGPTAKSSPIEFGSLAFEVPEEPMVLRNLKATMKAAKIASSQVVDKSTPNSSKLGYKNVSLWSSRSTTLEQQLRSILPINGLESWPDYETVSQIISSSSSRSDFDISEVVKPDLPMYDTLIVRLEEATEVRYGFDRLFSQWSYTSGRFELQKVCSTITLFFNKYEVRCFIYLAG